MSDVVVYHNPRCSKSRQMLALLDERGISFKTVLYMDQGLSAKEIRALLVKLGATARDLLRTSEDSYKQQNLADKSLDEAALIDAMVNEPRLFQRPVVVCGDRAMIARPAELALEILP